MEILYQSLYFETMFIKIAESQNLKISSEDWAMLGYAIRYRTERYRYNTVPYSPIIMVRLVNTRHRSVRNRTVPVPYKYKVSPQDLLDYFGPDAPPLEDPLSSMVMLDILKTMLATAPPLSSPHKDGWRNENLVEIAKDPTCGAALV